MAGLLIDIIDQVITQVTSVASPMASLSATLPSQVPLPPLQAWCPSKIFCPWSSMSCDLHLLISPLSPKRAISYVKLSNVTAYKSCLCPKHLTHCFFFLQFLTTSHTYSDVRLAAAVTGWDTDS